MKGEITNRTSRKNNLNFKFESKQLVHVVNIMNIFLDNKTKDFLNILSILFAYNSKAGLKEIFKIS